MVKPTPIRSDKKPKSSGKRTGRFVISPELADKLSPPDDPSSTIDGMEEFVVDMHTPSALTTQDEATWIKAQGWTPLEMLTHTYRSPFHKMSDRIAAAKAVLEYAHRKLPQKLEVEATGNLGVAQMDLKALTKLNAKELDQLEKLLTKAGEP